MLVYIARRIAAGFVILIAASFLVYLLVSWSGDPLAFTQEIQDPTQRAATTRQVTRALNLDTPVVERFARWLGNVLQGDFGTSARTGLPVWDDLSSRMLMTLKLVSAATVLSITTGVVVGMVSALRQYSGFDYLATFCTFVFFSLPLFWVAVILKAWGGVQFNDWLRDGARFSPLFIGIAAIAVGVVVAGFVGGPWPRRAGISAVAAAAVAGALAWIGATGWMLDPGLGFVGFTVVAVGIAVGATCLFAGWDNRPARHGALTVAAVAVAGYLPLRAVLDAGVDVWAVLALGAGAAALGAAIGWSLGGLDRGQVGRLGALVSGACAVVAFLDRTMQSWAEYSASSVVRGRPIRTIGDRETRLEGDFWMVANDTFGHLVLPTAALMLISVATYTRYSRASMLEVLAQDYIRTARAKGLTERTVIVRHALRNATIPLATVVATDTGALLGGAVVTETVFEWNAMGRLFIDGLRQFDPNRVMAFFVVVAVFAMACNLLADVTYAVLDPRIRVGR